MLQNDYRSTAFRIFTICKADHVTFTSVSLKYTKFSLPPHIHPPKEKHTNKKENKQKRKTENSCTIIIYDTLNATRKQDMQCKEARGSRSKCKREPSSWAHTVSFFQLVHPHKVVSTPTTGKDVHGIITICKVKCKNGRKKNEKRKKKKHTQKTRLQTVSHITPFSMKYWPLAFQRMCVFALNTALPFSWNHVRRYGDRCKRE